MASALAAFRAAALKGSAPASARAAFMALSPPAAVRLAHGGRDSGVAGMAHGSHMADNNPETFKREKERNLKGETGEFVPGVPGWNEKLASDSEAAVKAERSDATIEQMVEHTTKVVKELHHDEQHTERSPVNPSEAPSIKDNLKYDAQEHDKHTSGKA